ncbi:MAG: 23S rRNA (adenine(2030)-N(6))-methyltransferase RlmJ [Burkholderiales bacterium]|nr:23S rRNA (adenine(2030)-N(6))-methyltransferase RlmJ [Burkholderiales bacterium]
MFSYRHAYHAGNHADVLKHTVLVAVMKHLALKEVGFTAIDTHAGAGMYRLDSADANQSGEAQEGFLALMRNKSKLSGPMADALLDYRKVLDHFNREGGLLNYPGSPLIAHHLLREQDKLKLFEMHPTDIRGLQTRVEELRAGRQVMVMHEDGFNGLPKFLPPSTRRGLVFIDPSYEIKLDYERVVVAVSIGMKRFSTGTYVVWYPIIPRPQAHSLPRHLTNLARQADKPWLHATLRIRTGARIDATPGEKAKPIGLVDSGVVIINPPFTLYEQLQQALPQMVQLMGQDHLAGFSLTRG